MLNLMEELRIVEKKYDETNEDIYLRRKYCLDHLFEISRYNYQYVVEYCLENNIKGIVDIGCAMGYQSHFFLEHDIKYVGVDKCGEYFHNDDKFTYINAEYPIDLSQYKDYLAVSILCLTWNCYLTEKDITLHKQLKQLSQDFNRCLIYMQSSKVDIAKQYFKNIKRLDKNFTELISE